MWRSLQNPALELRGEGPRISRINTDGNGTEVSAYFGLNEAWGPDDYVRFDRESDFSYMPPADIVQFVDEHEDSIDDWRFGFQMGRSSGSARAWPALPASHHSEGTCLGFADGHAMYKRWRNSRTIRKVQHLTREFLESSPNNRDVEWMGRHTSVKKR